MLEYLPRLGGVPGQPQVRTGRVHDYFDDIAEHAEGLPVWNGEPLLRKPSRHLHHPGQ